MSVGRSSLIGQEVCGTVCTWEKGSLIRAGSELMTFYHQEQPPHLPFTKNQTAETYQSNYVIKSFQEVLIFINSVFRSNWGTVLTLYLVLVWMEEYYKLSKKINSGILWMNVCNWWVSKHYRKNTFRKVLILKYCMRTGCLMMKQFMRSYKEKNCIALTATCCKCICVMLHEHLYVLLR